MVIGYINQKTKREVLSEFIAFCIILFVYESDV